MRQAAGGFTRQILARSADGENRDALAAGTQGSPPEDAPPKGLASQAAANLSGMHHRPGSRIALATIEPSTEAAGRP
jgi:hypothetical protein